MNDKRKGGGAICQYCNNYDGNIAFHQAWECPVYKHSAAYIHRQNQTEHDYLASLDNPRPPIKTELSLSQACDEFFSDNSDGTQRMYVPKPNRFTFKCDSCKNEMTAPGAILFSPPLKSNGGTLTVRKFHFCQKCYELVCHFNGLPHEQIPDDSSNIPFTSTPLPMSFDPKNRRPR